MRIMNSPFLIGLFALVTLILVGATVGRMVGAAAGETVYVTLLLTTLSVWLLMRRRATHS